MLGTVRAFSMLQIMGWLTLSGSAFGHETEKHGKMVPVDDQMRKLHAMMPMFSVASAGLETALDKNEALKAETEAAKILAAIPDLKKSKPHKNIKQRKKFVEHASDLEKTVITTVSLIKNGDPVQAKAAFKTIEEICVACHAKFRD